MPRTMLTEHFCLAELTTSQTAARLGLDNVPPDYVIPNLRQVAGVLEIIRLHFARPINVSSGYRCEAVNKAVGGSPTSAHRYGLAADFTVQGTPNAEVCRWIAEHAKDMGVDQVIYEFGPRGWVHVGLAPVPRHETLTAVRAAGNTVYKPGIIG